VEELPNLPPIDLQPTLRQELRDQLADRERLPRLAAGDQPLSMLAPQNPLLVTADLAGRDTTRRPVAPNPVHRCADRDPEARRRLMSRQPFLFDRGHHTVPKIH